MSLKHCKTQTSLRSRKAKLPASTKHRFTFLKNNVDQKKEFRDMF